MSSLARDLDEYLQTLDPERAQHVEAAIRGLMAKPQPEDADDASYSGKGMLGLAHHAVDMGSMTNEEIDRAIYGA
jgi:hypothetical protein